MYNSRVLALGSRFRMGGEVRSRLRPHRRYSLYVLITAHHVMSTTVDGSRGPLVWGYGRHMSGRGATPVADLQADEWGGA